MGGGWGCCKWNCEWNTPSRLWNSANILQNLSHSALEQDKRDHPPTSYCHSWPGTSPNRSERTPWAGRITWSWGRRIGGWTGLLKVLHCKTSSHQGPLRSLSEGLKSFFNCIVMAIQRECFQEHSGTPCPHTLHGIRGSSHKKRGAEVLQRIPVLGAHTAWSTHCCPARHRKDSCFQHGSGQGHLLILGRPQRGSRWGWIEVRNLLGYMPIVGWGGRSCIIQGIAD